MGIYEVPKDATEFELFKSTGFDFVRGNADAGFLDQAGEHGFQVWIPLGGFSEVPDEAAKLKLQAHIQPVQNHPALAIWELPDEALWNCEQTRRAANDKEREAIRQKVNSWIRGGTGDAELLKNLYRKVSREHAFRNWKAEEETIAELWKALGEPDHQVATNLSGTFECEEELYHNLLEGYRTLRSSDPNHLVWQNHAPRNSFDLLQKHAAYCDAIGCDIYPIPSIYNGHSDLANTRPSSVGDYTERFKQVAPDKATLMVLQAFAWKNLHGEFQSSTHDDRGREPTYLESRFMAYDSIVRGANGLCYWGSHSAGRDSSAWTDLVPVIQELASIQKFLAAPEAAVPVDIEPQPSWWSIDRPVICSARKVGDDWLFILVNEAEGAQDVHLRFPEDFTGKRLYYLYDNQYVDLIEDAIVPLEFGSLGVRILSTNPDLEVPELRGLSREVPDPFPKHP
ncbi:MAG: hypothetical protein KC917_03155 [Candidatus Omnitrophica bacterium]|nr:hypothetical protein [Candidatus Omnitrophota bacterium]